MKKKLLGAIASVLVVSMFAACSGGSTSPTPSNGTQTSTPESSKETTQESPNTSGKITLKVAGSTSVAPLMKVLKEDYEAKNNNITIEVQESGSSAGITATVEKAAEIGMSSRDLKDEEKSKGLKDIEIALDGIAVIVNNNNSVKELTKDQITKIYTGEITNWKEVGGEDKDIIIYSREDGSGTRGAFDELLKLEKDGASLLSPDVLFENSTGAIKANVVSTPNAIGYISLGSADDTITAVKVDGVECTEETILNKTYAIQRPFLLITLGEPTADAKAFMDYILSEDGQKIVSEHNYVPVK